MNLPKIQQIIRLSEKFDVFKDISNYFVETSLNELKLGRREEVGGVKREEGGGRREESGGKKEEGGGMREEEGGEEENKKLISEMCKGIERIWNRLFRKEDGQVLTLFGDRSGDIAKQIIAYTYECYIGYYVEKLVANNVNSKEKFLK